MSTDPRLLLGKSAALQARADRIHVWEFVLESDNETLQLCRGLLSEDESARASRFVFPRHRDQYTIAHGVVRWLLSRYTNIAPRQITFAKGSADKPFLTGVPDAPSFNLTHSGNRGMLAVRAAGDIGVDLEQARADIEALALGRRYFFGEEFDDIAAAPPAEQVQRFFRYWVAKEAVLKAQGVGLGFPLDRFHIGFEPGRERARVTSLDPSILRPDWTVRVLASGPEWHAAVVAQGTDWEPSIQSP
jgi:4'-phosphopantetheinyl transferase